MIPTFARRIGRSLRDNQKKLISEFLPQLKFNMDEVKNFNQVTFEIGFGNGEFTLKNAIENPNDLHIACDPYLNGVAALLGKIKEAEIRNIRIFGDDARKLLDELPDNFLNNVYIICPDPWPKKRYHKRRIIQKDFIEYLRKKLMTGGHLVFVTDHHGYAEWILDESKKCYDFLKNTTIDDFHELPSNWHHTKYQRRGIDLGSKIHYFKLPK